MQKWEYKFLHVAGQVGQIPYNGNYIQELGQDGWELISVDNGVAYFKRPLRAEATITDLVKCFDPREGESVGPYPHVSQGVYGD